MPLYDYECRECGHKFEAEQGIKDAKLEQCPECGQPTLERLIGCTSFVLRGGGWASDRYGASHRQKAKV